MTKHYKLEKPDKLVGNLRRLGFRSTPQTTRITSMLALSAFFTVMQPLIHGEPCHASNETADTRCSAENTEVKRFLDENRNKFDLVFDSKFSSNDSVDLRVSITIKNGKMRVAKITSEPVISRKTGRELQGILARMLKLLDPPKTNCTMIEVDYVKEPPEEQNGRENEVFDEDEEVLVRAVKLNTLKTS